jgi:para-nitrobenzyl esterase
MDNVVNTASGKLESVNRDGIFLFRGVPYAAPPVGEKRWLAPETLKPWQGVREAKKLGPVAPQNLNRTRAVQGGDEQFAVQSEDCLFLNISTPGLDNRRRPVMFWIHGGGCIDGAGSQGVYNGRWLARRGNVVVVTINYRLGSLGFLNLNEITGGKIPASGNEGFLDQMAALKWVRDNIEAFGGDPGNVTIFGQSAGAHSVAVLLGMPAAKGLFHRAICQSGTAGNVCPLDEAKHSSEVFVNALGVSGKDATALRAVPVDRLLAAQAKFARSRDVRFRAVADGRVLPEPPQTAVENGSIKSIPLMVGSTLEETKMYMDITAIDEAELNHRLEGMLPPEYRQVMLNAYQEIRTRRGLPVTPGEIFSAIQTDATFRTGAFRLLEAQRKQNKDVFSYLYTWKSPAMGGRLGACHAIELGFIFGNLDPVFTGQGPEADTLVRKTQDAWVAFARTGNPSCESLGKWPRFTEKQETMVLGKECAVVNGPCHDELAVWNRLPKSVKIAFILG